MDKDYNKEITLYLDELVFLRRYVFFFRWLNRVLTDLFFPFFLGFVYSVSLFTCSFSFRTELINLKVSEFSWCESNVFSFQTLLLPLLEKPFLSSVDIKIISSLSCYVVTLVFISWVKSRPSLMLQRRSSGEKSAYSKHHQFLPPRMKGPKLVLINLTVT